jgi:hypothetical protein
LGNQGAMSERMSNEHGHNFSEKAEDEDGTSVEPSLPGAPADTPRPQDVPANEGGEDEPKTS